MAALVLALGIRFAYAHFHRCLYYLACRSLAYPGALASVNVTLHAFVISALRV